MNQEAADNPYAPPASDRWPHAQEGGESLWRVEGGKLLVRPGAVLPAVCLIDGTEGSPGSWTLLAFSSASLTGLRTPSESITLFQSRPALLKASCMLLGGPVLGTVAGVITSLVMQDDGSATAASITVSFALIVLGGVLPIWRLSKSPEISVMGVDGWHEVLRVHPVAIERLRTMQDG